jgi:hypothetical protein
MTNNEASARRRVRTILAAVAVVAAMWFRPAVGLGGEVPSAEFVPGQYNLTLGEYDIGLLGYVASEVFIKGTAQSYKFSEPPSLDGKWHAALLQTAPYVTPSSSSG